MCACVRKYLSARRGRRGVDQQMRVCVCFGGGEGGQRRVVDCIVTHTHKRDSNQIERQISKHAERATWACVMPVNSVQNSERTGFKTGRQYDWNSATTTMSRRSTTTTGNSIISCGKSEASRSHVHSKSITQRYRHPRASALSRRALFRSHTHTRAHTHVERWMS
jgi:hypothetical protein